MTAQPIHIDLRDLTQAHVDEAMPHMGRCNYASPCIIGTLIPKRRRAALDHLRVGGLNIFGLRDAGRVTLPPEQAEAADALQGAFDEKQLDRVLELVKPWLEASK